MTLPRGGGDIKQNWHGHGVNPTVWVWLFGAMVGRIAALPVPTVWTQAMGRTEIRGRGAEGRPSVEWNPLKKQGLLVWAPRGAKAASATVATLLFQVEPPFVE